MLQHLHYLSTYYPNRALALVLGVIVFSLLLFGGNVFRKTLSRRLLLVLNVLATVLCVVGIIAALVLLNQRVSKKETAKYWSQKKENLRIHDTGKYVFGIDVSHYNGKIDWGKVNQSQHPIRFVFVRATMGKNGTDYAYATNLEKAAEQGFLVGTYHYYRPNENSTKQFNHFKKHAKVQKGHLRPVLDIEVASKHGNANLLIGLKNWLSLAEKTYGVKPIIYTGRHFYHTQLKGHFDDYPLWIASYNHKSKLKGIDWHMHQFSDRVIVKGIPSFVDGNDYKGTYESLVKELVIQ